MKLSLINRMKAWLKYGSLGTYPNKLWKSREEHMLFLQRVDRQIKDDARLRRINREALARQGRLYDPPFDPWGSL